MVRWTGRVADPGVLAFRVTGVVSFKDCWKYGRKGVKGCRGVKCVQVEKKN